MQEFSPPNASWNPFRSWATIAERQIQGPFWIIKTKNRKRFGRQRRSFTGSGINMRHFPEPFPFITSSGGGAPSTSFCKKLAEAFNHSHPCHIAIPELHILSREFADSTKEGAGGGLREPFSPVIYFFISREIKAFRKLLNVLFFFEESVYFGRWRGQG